MPWELIADYKATKDMSPEDRQWGGLAAGITAKLMELEPRLRFIIRAMPTKETQWLVQPLRPEEVSPKFKDKLVTPNLGMKWIRQYTCHTCLRSDNAPLWVPEGKLLLHKGHDIKASEPTGQARISSWEPNYRLWMGAPERLRGRILKEQGWYSTVVTSDCLGGELSGFHAALLLPPISYEDKTIKMRSMTLEKVIHLPSNANEAVQSILNYMLNNDKEALEPIPGEEIAVENEQAQIEIIKKKVEAAGRYLNNMRQQKPKQQVKIEEQPK